MFRYIVFSVVLSSVVFAGRPLIPKATYYVDSLNGSDSNNGTDAATPFATISHVMGLSLTNGTVIALGTTTAGSGASWRDSINTSQSGLTFIGYGSVQPLLDCSSSIDAGSWTKTGGYTSIYQATVTTDDVNGWIRVWEDNVGFVRATSLPNLDATTSAYYTSGDPNGGGATSFTLYVHASNGTNPASNGKTYEFNQHGCFALTGSNSTVINLRTRRNLANDGSIVCHSYCRLIDTLSEDGTKHNVLVGTGSYVFRSVAHNAYYANQGSTLFVYNDNSPSGEGVTFNRSSAYVDTPSSGAGGIGAFIGHVNISGSFGLVLYDNVSAMNTSIGIEAGGSTRFVALNPTLTTVDTGVGSSGITTVVGGTMSCATCVLNLSTSTVTFTSVALQATTTAVVQDFSRDSSFTFSGSTITAPAFAGYIFIQSASGTGLTVNVNNCTINGDHAYVYYLQSPYTLNSDYNAFQTNSFNFNLGASAYGTVAAYQAGTGQDAHSTHP